MTVGPFRRNCGVNSLAPYVLSDIMRARMKPFVPALLLALGACVGAPEENRPIAKAPTGQQTSSDLAKKLDQQNISPDGKVAETPDGPKPPEIDSTRRFEYAD